MGLSATIKFKRKMIQHFEFGLKYKKKLVFILYIQQADNNATSLSDGLTFQFSINYE